MQDELHLISGPLGTMAGLYETAIEALSCHGDGSGGVVRPKVIASTATVRRAHSQVQALFGRRELSIFPPPGVDDSETFLHGWILRRPGLFTWESRRLGECSRDEGHPAQQPTWPF